MGWGILGEGGRSVGISSRVCGGRDSILCHVCRSQRGVLEGWYEDASEIRRVSVACGGGYIFH